MRTGVNPVRKTLGITYPRRAHDED
jgi:hypothetical protein